MLQAIKAIASHEHKARMVSLVDPVSASELEGSQNVIITSTNEKCAKLEREFLISAQAAVYNARCNVREKSERAHGSDKGQRNKKENSWYVTRYLSLLPPSPSPLLARVFGCICPSRIRARDASGLCACRFFLHARRPFARL